MTTEGAPLRSLLASFTIEVDKHGDLGRGMAAVDVLKAKVEGLQAAAAPAAAAIRGLLGAGAGGGGAVRGLLGAGGGFGGGPLARVGGGGITAPAGVRGLLGSGLPDLRGFDFARAVPQVGAFRKAIDDARASLNTPRFGFISSLFTMQNAVRGFAAVAGFGALKGLVDQIGGIGEQAAKLGVANDEFQRLDVLAKQNATSVQALGTAFRTLATNAVDPSADAAAAFRQLNVETKNADGTFKTRNELFFETAGALADIEDTTVRANTAQKIYGRSAIELSALLSGGREGLEAQRAELEKLPVLSDEVIASADKFSDQWEVVKVQLLALAGPVLEKVVIPAMQLLLDVVSGAADVIAELTKNMSPLTIGIAALAIGLTPLVSQMRALVALGGGWGKVLGNMGASAGKAIKSFAPLIAMFLILEDLLVFFSGGKSATGRLLDLFGEGTGKGVQKTIKDLTTAFQDLWKWILGDGGGEKAKTLFAEIDQGLRLLINDALAQIPGTGRTAGLEGLHAYERSERSRVTMTRDTRGEADPFLSGQFGGANLIPVPGSEQFGPPLAPPAVFNHAGNNVTITVGDRGTAKDVGREMMQVLERDRAAIAAGVP